jgi:hypothetical protein
MEPKVVNADAAPLTSLLIRSCAQRFVCGEGLNPSTRHLRMRRTGKRHEIALIFYGSWQLDEDKYVGRHGGGEIRGSSRIFQKKRNLELQTYLSSSVSLRRSGTFCAKNDSRSKFTCIDIHSTNPSHIPWLRCDVVQPPHSSSSIGIGILYTISLRC